MAFEYGEDLDVLPMDPVHVPVGSLEYLSNRGITDLGHDATAFGECLETPRSGNDSSINCSPAAE